MENRFWIGTHPDPKKRIQIVVSDTDAKQIPPRGQVGQAIVGDLLTGRLFHVRRASCGLPGCLCALELVN
jgi:hypothetical protein